MKQLLSSESVMSYFDSEKKTTVYVDASPVGLGANLVQDGRTIAYASRALTSVIESRYSQIEREALGIVYGCEHLHMYLVGCKFSVVTDHKPLLYIWKKISPPLRIARWGLRLLPYKFDIEYQKDEDNIADYLSRHPDKHSVVGPSITEEYVNCIANTSVPLALNMSNIVQATKEYELLQQVITVIKLNK